MLFQYFEWEDGNPNGEDRRGLFARMSKGNGVIPSGKITLSGDGAFIGPVVEPIGFTCNQQLEEWHGKYLEDEFRGYPYRVGELNPDFDPTLDYVARIVRKEWTPIAISGVARVKASTNIGIYPSNKNGDTVDIANDGTVVDAGTKGKYKVIRVVKQKEIWSGPEGVFRRRRQIQDHGHGVVEILVV
mgnify:CR=1 FL=1